MKDIRYEAQDILSRRENSEWELRQKLAKKGFIRKEIDETIDWLKSKKYLGDESYARAYVQSILRQKLVGKAWLKQKLQQKKIASITIDKVLASELPASKEKELAKQAATQWKKSHSRYAEDSGRLGRFLLSRGFASYIVQEISRNDTY